MSIVSKTQKTEDKAWQKILSNAITDPKELCDLLELAPDIFDLLSHHDSKISNFDLKVPRNLLSRMVKGDVDDPILKQLLPVQAELLLNKMYTKDPVGDVDAIAGSGMIHKYHGRLLIVMTGACAVHCRYCFRRHFNYLESSFSIKQMHQITRYLQQHNDIDEVILSGGDPLSVSDQKLQSMVQLLESEPQIKKLRIHTRLPIIIPERMTRFLVNLFSSTRLKVIIVFHINHANEIDDSVSVMLNKLSEARLVLLNQSVLLKGVNNNPDALVALSEKLFENNIYPYYLHAMDKVEGAIHFDLEEEEIREVYHQISMRLSGYLLPKLVREISNKPYKVPFFS